MKRVLAFDFGASTGRAILADYDGKRLTYREVHRFENIPLMKNGHVHHDVPYLLQEVKKAIELAGEADALAFDTWGVDYALLDENGALLHPPFHYRDERTAGAVEKAVAIMPLAEIYAETGNQIMPINTLFQLLQEDCLHKADKLLFMPDLFAYLLCHHSVCEQTIASTSQLLNPLTRQFSSKILDAFGIPKSLFAPLKESATLCGMYQDIQVISVAGHDTQCAVAAMPCTQGNAAFLSCGTWSLIGCETDAPIVTQESRELALSNELGANGKINYLKNISGLWLLQETKRALAQAGECYTYDELEALAKEATPFQSFIDPDAPMLSAHGDLPEKIRAYCRQTQQEVPQSVGDLIRCIYESLALKYRLALEQIEQCAARKFDVLHMLGGGTKDAFLCQMTADSTGLRVVAGPVEATALGNIILQLIALGVLPDVASGRQLIKESEILKEYTPMQTQAWNGAYQRFKKMLKEAI